MAVGPHDSAQARHRAREALRRGVFAEGVTESTWDGYDRTLRRATREGFDVHAFLQDSHQARLAGDAWNHQRRNAGPCARRNDVRMLNALARACHTTGYHQELVHWQQPARTHGRPSALAPRDLDAILEASHDLCPRDAALLEVALLTGAGRTELSSMNAHDLDEATHRIYVRGAKLHQSYWLPIEPELWRSDGPLHQYLVDRPTPTDGHALWVTQRHPHRRLGPRGVYLVLRHLRQLTGHTVHATATRHTRGRRLWKAGLPEALVQIYLRQSTRSATRIYTEPGLDDLMEWMTSHGGPGLHGTPTPTGVCPTCHRPW